MAERPGYLPACSGYQIFFHGSWLVNNHKWNSISSQPKLLPPNSKSSISETIDAPDPVALAQTTSGSPTTMDVHWVTPFTDAETGTDPQNHHLVQLHKHLTPSHLTDTVGQLQFLVLDYLEFDRHTEPSFNKQVARETAIPRDTPQSNFVTVV